jgi:NADPH:quinone reductase-like Zn-dependent oxidoreductase
MKAIVQTRYGPADTFEQRDIEPPEVGDGDVLVQVEGAGIDRGTWHLMQGLPYVVRLVGYGLRAPKQPVPGLDVAGVVVRTGQEVTRFREGDAVFGIGRATFAELACAREDALALRPSGLGLEAAAVPVSGLTALQAVRDRARVGSGQRVLVLGASGGVGTLAVQLAAAYGAEVTGVCSTSKTDLVRDLGAAHVIDYTTGGLDRATDRYDAIIDTGGNRPLSDLRRRLEPRGRLVIVGGEGGGRWIGGADRQLRARLLSPFVSQSMDTFISRVSSADLHSLAGHLEGGTVRPVVDRTFPLGEAAKAMQYLLEGHVRGKVVLAVGGGATA